MESVTLNIRLDLEETTLLLPFKSSCHHCMSEHEFPEAALFIHPCNYITGFKKKKKYWATILCQGDFPDCFCLTDWNCLWLKGQCSWHYILFPASSASLAYCLLSSSLPTLSSKLICLVSIFQSSSPSLTGFLLLLSEYQLYFCYLKYPGKSMNTEFIYHCFWMLSQHR